MIVAVMNVDHERLIRGFENNQDWALLAEQLNINNQRQEVSKQSNKQWEEKRLLNEAITNKDHSLIDTHFQHIIAWIEEHLIVTRDETDLWLEALMGSHARFKRSPVQSIDPSSLRESCTQFQRHETPYKSTTGSTEKIV